jgi:hypothetical protein
VNLEATFNLSQILSQKDGLGCSTTCVHVLIGGGGVTVSEQVADAEKVA